MHTWLLPIPSCRWGYLLLRASLLHCFSSCSFFFPTLPILRVWHSQAQADTTFWKTAVRFSLYWLYLNSPTPYLHWFPYFIFFCLKNARSKFSSNFPCDYKILNLPLPTTFYSQLYSLTKHEPTPIKVIKYRNSQWVRKSLWRKNQNAHFIWLQCLILCACSAAEDDLHLNFCVCILYCDRSHWSIRDDGVYDVLACWNTSLSLAMSKFCHSWFRM